MAIEVTVRDTETGEALRWRWMDDALGVLRDEIRAARYDLAVRRDNCLTDLELIAALDVYQECGR